MKMSKPISRRDFIRQSSRLAAAAGMAGSGILLKGCRNGKDYDLIISGGTIFDGLGRQPFQADIGVAGGLIRKVGKIASSRALAVIEAQGLSVCPGFIDVHDHTDVQLLVCPQADSAVRQGITTLVSGNCGSSLFPIAAEILEESREGLEKAYGITLDWNDISGFLSRLEAQGTAINYATLVGQGTIRGTVMGFNDRPAKQEELEKMKALVEDNIRRGAFGLSTGLEYVPGGFSEPFEITELCRVVARYGGVYATHMREEGERLIESLEESVAAAGESGSRLQISHFKVAYAPNWGKIDQALEVIEEAKTSGIDIFCDRYPYTAGSTGLSYHFPIWARQGTTQEFLARLKDPTLEARLREAIAEREKKLGSWSNVVVTEVTTDKNKKFEGMSILDAERETGKDAFEFMRDLLIEEENGVGMIAFMMTEENLERILSHPLVGVGCDGSVRSLSGPLSAGKPHPRSYGTFPRVLGKYVRERKIVPLQEMIMKMTSIPAQRFGFEGRGVIDEGACADIVVFDESKIADKATWTEPHQYPDGIAAVLVNGQVVVESGEHSGRRPGRVLRKKV